MPCFAVRQPSVNSLSDRFAANVLAAARMLPREISSAAMVTAGGSFDAALLISGTDTSVCTSRSSSSSSITMTTELLDIWRVSRNGLPEWDKLLLLLLLRPIPLEVLSSIELLLSYDNLVGLGSPRLYADSDECCPRRLPLSHNHSWLCSSCIVIRCFGLTVSNDRTRFFALSFTPNQMLELRSNEPRRILLVMMSISFEVDARLS
uniref:Uncharacterized protein n=1 Tax=Anopheles culicifacies TaxID=139723 RepID=A0A182MK70_9DIPT